LEQVLLLLLFDEFCRSALFFLTEGIMFLPFFRQLLS
jgi:hypothetical protein